MVNPQMLEWIKQRLAQSADKGELKTVLLGNGWTEVDIDEAFRTLETPSETTGPISSAIQPIQATTEQATPKKHKILKIFLWILATPILLVMLYLIFVVVFSFVSKDDLTINDSDLQLVKVEILNEENAYFELEKMAKVYSPKMEPAIVSEIMFGYKPWNSNIAKDIIATSTEVLQYFREASNKPKYQNPRNSIPESINVENSMTNLGINPLTSLRSVSRISLFNALFLAKEGKEKEAIEEAMLSIVLAQKIENSQPPLVDVLIANTLKTNSLHTINSILSETTTTTLGTIDYISYAENLATFYNNKQGLEKAFKGEYLFLKDSMRVYNDILSGESKVTFGMPDDLNKLKKIPRFLTKFYFRKNESTNILAEFNRANIEMLSQQCGEIKYKIDAPTGLSWKTPFQENVLGKILTRTFYISFENSVKKKCYADLYLSATRIMLALKAYKLDNGNLPTVLNELVPGYLPSLPMDPFAVPPAPLQYSRANKTLSSVGKDLEKIGVDTYPAGGYQIKF